MPRVFISYRRDDTRATAGRIYDHLADAFGASNVFIDVEAVPPGVDFRQYLDDLIRSCDVVLAIIGPRWATLSDEAGRRRLADPGDFVRLEIEAALAAGMLVIPVLVDDAAMPHPGELPSSLRDLVYRNAATVQYAGFRRDMAALINRIEAQFRRPARSRARGLWTWGALIGLLGIVAAVIAVIALSGGDDDNGGTPGPATDGLDAAVIRTLVAATDTPEVTATPEATAAPEVTATPEATATLEATATPDATATPGSPIGEGCQYAQPLAPVGVGDLADVTPAGVGLSLREAAGLSATLIRKLPAGTQLQILDGPRCADGYRWWSVQVVEDGRTGWVGDSDQDEIWLRRVESPSN
jgi:hypothetical protein